MHPDPRALPSHLPQRNARRQLQYIGTLTQEALARSASSAGAAGLDKGTFGTNWLAGSRALAKTVTYEVVTAVSEFGANYLFVRDVAAAAGLTTFSIVIAPIVYYVHEKG